MNIKDLDFQTFAINTVRVLAVDAVQHAKSGHPGTPMALTPMAHVLWTQFMNYNPKNPEWANRDRFVLSPGHACMLLYNFLFLTGYDLTLDDIKQFRQLDSKTPGHPEYGLTPGVETTTGPLGQGFANGVGMAIAQKQLAARYNMPGFPIFNYHIYTICSDGDLMEGVTSEAASLAGHLQLGNMIYLYDDNHISIEGNTDLAFTEDVGKRFEAYGWHVQSVSDVNDLHALSLSLVNAKAEIQRPSLIRVRSIIAYGSPNKSGKADSHGSPLGTEEVKLVKDFFGFDREKSFVLPNEVLQYYRKAGEKGVDTEVEWRKLFADYTIKYPGLAQEFVSATNGEFSGDWEKALPVFASGEKKIATRDASAKVLNAIAGKIPNFIGGSADLAPSTKTNLNDFESFSHENRNGRNLHFGIREHSMGSILNGMALTKGVKPFGATFLLFSEYMRPPIRLAAIMKISPIIVYTHDSIGLGEDGTTHQPVEQLISLRSIPGITVIRPADANETAQAWRVAVRHKGGPVVLVFTRQGLPVIDQDKYAKAGNLEKGAYILSEASMTPQLILIATGSEVALVLEAQQVLEKEGIATRVVSMPSWELFEKQDTAYKEMVFPKANKRRLAVEMASPMGWREYITDGGDMLGITTYGKSAPVEVLYEIFGFTVDNVIKRAKALLEK
ncbi:MAG TPA: transketolase [Puia sp.]|jgi:transketolase|nr:transketolase [Puia sp.]